jgi:hypothetical protein
MNCAFFLLEFVDCCRGDSRGRWRAVLLAFLLLASGTGFAADGLDGRLIVGYQGWFGCPGDFEGNRGWQHWFHGEPSPQSLTVDQLPALDDFPKQELCDTGLKRADGRPLYVFSSQNRNIVDQHLEWMRRQGIDGLAFQRFVAHLAQPPLARRSDNVLGHVRRSAERTGRVFYVTYDVSGAEPGRVIADIRRDWKHLAGTQKLPASSAYLHHRGKPVVHLWGFGLRDRPGDAAEVAQLITDLKAGRDGLAAATVIGGVPTGWRTLTGDSRREADWAATYRAYDVISPWSVGRYRDEAGADRFRQRVIEPDLQETRRLGIGYQPVVFPGFSWHNLMTVRGERAKAVFNQIPRRCGRFLSHQVGNALASGATMLYAAMFDEVDEATALFPLETGRDAAPAQVTLLPLDADGCALAKDHYLDLAGQAARQLQALPRR